MTPAADCPGGGPPDLRTATLLDDPARVAAVSRLVSALDDTTGIDRLTRLTARLLQAPYAQVSLIGSEQVVASAAGLDTAGSRGPREDSLCTHTAGEAEALVIGDTRTDPRVAGLTPVAAGGVRAYLGIPLRNSDGVWLGAVCAYDDTPRDWTPGQVQVLAELADSVVAELELRALGVEAGRTAARLELALDASGIGSFDLDLQTQALVWDDRLIRLFGYDRDTFVEHFDSFIARLHAEDAERTVAAIDAVVQSHGELNLEYRIVRPTGDVRWVEARGRVLSSRSGARLIGVAYDTTELRTARDRLARTLETMNDAFYLLDSEWRFGYVNREAEDLLQRSREDLLGKTLWDEFPEALGTAFQEQYERAVRTGEPVVFEAPFAPLGGWYEMNAWPGPEGLSVYFKEITGRREAEGERQRAYAEREQAVVERERAYAAAEAANTRLALLAEVSTRLSRSLEPAEVLEGLGELVVPDLGRYAVVALTADTASLLRGEEMPGDPERVHVVHVAHEQGAQRDALVALAEALPVSTADPIGLGAVIRTGRPEWLPEVTDEDLALFASQEHPLEELKQVSTGSALTVPLTSRGRVLGALSVAAPGGGPIDRALLVDLAGRAAVALDNALLFGAERRTGITLQRSLLPRDLPALPGLRTAVRYLPGTSGAFVGGDWYQGVQVGPHLVLAMGDVMGHGMRSAARMGQLRAIVATLAREGHGPAALLSRLAASVDVLLDLELATLLVAAYDPAACTLTVASAGHPPPLHARRSGGAAFVDVEPGPPLGSFAGTYEQVVVELEPGDTVVLYTDGLVENRSESLDVGLARLREAVQDRQLAPEALADALLDRLDRRAGGDDDVALLVLRPEP